MNIKSLVTTAPKVAKRFLTKRSPEILLATGIGSSLAAIIFAVKATPKAIQAVNDAKREIHKDLPDDMLEPIVLPVKETVKATWKYYIPSAILFICSTICLVAGHRVSAKRNAALAAACTITEQALREYKDAIAEQVAPEVKEKIEEAVSTKQMSNAKDPRDSKVYISDGDGVLCYDPWSDRLFQYKPTAIEAALNELNERMLTSGYGGYASLNDFYDMIDREHTKAGDVLGWNISWGLPKIRFSSQIAKDGRPCLVIGFDMAPKSGFDN